MIGSSPGENVNRLGDALGQVVARAHTAGSLTVVLCFESDWLRRTRLIPPSACSPSLSLGEAADALIVEAQVLRDVLQRVAWPAKRLDRSGLPKQFPLGLSLWNMIPREEAWTPTSS